ncbi:hypothetical protein AM232_07265 [Bacillus sp. FJAT-21352]|nr:hypothetical protein AM232_07265 [Bacillus sp. FJAT-21352]
MNSRFEHLYEKIRQTIKEAKKTEVIVGIEPTGHYRMNLANFLDHLSCGNGVISNVARAIFPKAGKT